MALLVPSVRADDLASVREKAAICDPNSPLRCLKPNADGSLAVTGGTGGGSAAADQSGTNATDAQATSTNNQHALAFNYGWNGSAWDRVYVDATTHGLLGKLVGTLPPFASPPNFIDTLTEAGVGGVGDAAYAGTGNASAIAALKGVYAKLAAPLTVTPSASALGPSLGPAAAQGVVQQDGQKASLSASTSGTLATVNSSDAGFPTIVGGAWATSGYSSVVIRVTAPGVGNTIGVQFSSDNGSTWDATSHIVPINNVGGAAPSAALSQTTANVVPVEGALMRLVETIGGGTPAVTAVVTMKVTNVAPIANYVTVGSGSISQASPNTANVYNAWITGQSALGITGGVSFFSRIPSSAASTNTTVAKASGGRVYKIVGCNLSTSDVTYHFTNTSTAPTPGTTTVLFSRTAPASATAGKCNPYSWDMSDIGWYFSTGISYWLSTGTTSYLDTDATALAAGAVSSSVEYQ